MIVSSKQIKVTYYINGIEIMSNTTNFIPEENDVLHLGEQRVHCSRSVIKVKEKGATTIDVECTPIPGRG